MHTHTHTHTLAHTHTPTHHRRHSGCRCSMIGEPNHVYHLPPGFISLRKEERLPELFQQTSVSSYSWRRRTQLADKVVSPSCFRSSLLPCLFSWCPLCHSVSPSVISESCNVSRPSMYSLLDNVYDVISN